MADGDIFGIPLNAFGAGAGVLGAGADLYSFGQQQQQRNALQQIYQILANPQKLNQFIGKLYQPMGAAENSAVQRDLGANWATATGGAPGGAMAQFIADAMAKLESGRYQDASRTAIESLTRATGTADRYPSMPGGNLGGITKALEMLKQIRGSGQPASTPYPMPTTVEPDLMQTGYSFNG